MTQADLQYQIEMQNENLDVLDKEVRKFNVKQNQINAELHDQNENIIPQINEDLDKNDQKIQANNQELSRFEQIASHAKISWIVIIIELIVIIVLICIPGKKDDNAQ